jgi:hypothetical protein
MLRRKKFILIALLAIVVLAGSIGGVAFAQTEDEDDSQPEPRCGALLDEVCDYYNEIANQDPNDDIEPIDCDILKEAFTEAGKGMMGEFRNKLGEFRNKFRHRLFDQDEMTQEQIDEWEAWLESRPDFPTDEFKEWLESRPDDIPFAPGLRGPFGHRSSGGFGGRFHIWCEPEPTE